MAEEAFALSPISASAAVPTEADYHAIREAFMETARGRWFLTEYAKRNRNADTAMVLEAVARIEQSIGAVHHDTAASASSEALLKAALEKARTAIHQQFSETGFDHALLPWRKSARVIREIIWGLRESGADPRICNILDGQARAIEAACDDFPLNEIRERIFAALDTAVSQDQEAAPVTVEGTSSTHAAGVTADPVPNPAQVLEPEPQPKVAAPETVVVEAAALATIAEPTAAETKVAMEASAPVSSETVAPDTAPTTDSEPEAVALAEEAVEPEPIVAVAELPQADPVPMPAAPTPVAAAPRSIMTASASQPAPQPMAEREADEIPAITTAASLPQVAPATEPALESTVAVEAEGGGSEDLWADIEAEIAPLPPFDPLHEASLGASLIAQGVVARPSNGRADLLAPIRRMSHAERIAFFS